MYQSIFIVYINIIILIYFIILFLYFLEPKTKEISFIFFHIKILNTFYPITFRSILTYLDKNQPIETFPYFPRLNYTLIFRIRKNSLPTNPSERHSEVDYCVPIHISRQNKSNGRSTFECTRCPKGAFAKLTRKQLWKSIGSQPPLLLTYTGNPRRQYFSFAS